MNSLFGFITLSRAMWAMGLAGLGSVSILLQNAEISLDITSMIVGLVGGLALFLYGLERMAGSLRASSARKLRGALRRVTKNRATSLLTGTAVTALIQSSSATTVMLVGLVSAGAMTFGQSLGVILGASIGTTITGQIVAFKITKYALLLVAIGFFLRFTSKNTATRQVSTVVFGLGLIFFGMDTMNHAMAPLKDYEPFLSFLESLANPLLGIIAGAIFTALVQSSSATIGVIIILATQGVLTLESGIALALGANIGTCVTALLAAIGKPREGVRVAIAHILFKIIGVILILPFIDQLAELVTAISPRANDALSASEQMAEVVPRQIANAHTIFNVGIALLFLPIIPAYKRVVERILPDKVEESLAQKVRLEFLPSGSPELAFTALQQQIGKMAGVVLEMMHGSRHILTENEPARIDAIIEQDEEVNRIHMEFLKLKQKLSTQEISEELSDRLDTHLEYAHLLERIADIIKVEIARYGRMRMENDLVVSAETEARIHEFYTLVEYAFSKAADILNGDSVDEIGDANEIIAMKGQVHHAVESFHTYLLENRVVADRPNREQLYRIESGIVEAHERIFFLIRNMAKVIARVSE